MYRIAVTGMTASQRSVKNNRSSLSFTGVLSDAVQFTCTDTQLDWLEPSVSVTEKDLEKYDSVIVGVAPVTSLASNYVYPALRTMSVARKIGNLSLLIDAPEPIKIAHSISAIQRSPESLFKPLYSKRSGYTESLATLKIKSSLHNEIDRLAETWDCPVLYPSTPFYDHSSRIRETVTGNDSTVVGLNFDLMYSHDSVQFSSQIGSREWMVDSHKSSWFKKLQPLLSIGWQPMTQRRMESDASVQHRMVQSFGVILPPQHDGTCWWSHRCAQALSCMVPISSEWRCTGAIGTEWATLAVTIEEISYADRTLLAAEQAESYFSRLNDVEAETQKFIQTLGVRNGNLI